MRFRYRLGAWLLGPWLRAAFDEHSSAAFGVDSLGAKIDAATRRSALRPFVNGRAFDMYHPRRCGRG